MRALQEVARRLGVAAAAERDHGVRAKGRPGGEPCSGVRPVRVARGCVTSMAGRAVQTGRRVHVA